VAITLKMLRNGAVGFIDWLDSLFHPLVSATIRITDVHERPIGMWLKSNNRADLALGFWRSPIIGDIDLVSAA
jgi:hypothetical protein